MADETQGPGAVQAELAALAKRRPFDRMERDHLEWLLARLQERTYPQGHVIVPSGATPEELYLLRQGAVRLEASGLSDSRGVGELQPGDFFPVEEVQLGRPALFGHRAAVEVRCGLLSRADREQLQALSAPFREFCQKRAQRLVERMRRIQQAQLAEMDSVMTQVSVQRTGTQELGAAIKLARDVATLARTAGQVHDLARRMMAQGVAAAQVTRLVSAMNDKLTERVVQLEVDGAALAGVDFCWVALGSEGRMEQTLCTDQDNGLVFAPARGQDPEEVRARLLPMAVRINQALAACGFPLCKGDVMAGNPAWCLSVDEWRARFAGWLAEPRPEALLQASIFFDLRAVYGNRELVRGLQAWLAREAPGAPRFLSRLAQAALRNQPPLGLLWGFKLEPSGPHAGTLDLKRDAVRIFVDAARVLGLAHAASAPGTEQRLREAAARGAVPARDADGWIEAFQYVQVLRLRRQYDQSQAGQELHNRVRPDELNTLERRFLLEALRQARALQKRMGHDLGVEAERA